MQHLDVGKVVYIKLDGFSAESFPLDYNSRLVACIGAKSSMIANAKEFNLSDKRVSKIWEQRYTNPNKSSFVVSIFKKRMYGCDIKIGEVELKVSGFERDTVVTHEFKLHNGKIRGNQPTVTISVHVSENGAAPFEAPNDGKIVSNVEIRRRCF